MHGQSSRGGSNSTFDRATKARRQAPAPYNNLNTSHLSSSNQNQVNKRIVHQNSTQNLNNSSHHLASQAVAAGSSMRQNLNKGPPAETFKKPNH